MLNFLDTVPTPEVGPIDQQVKEAVPVPPPLTLMIKTLPSAGCVGLTTDLYTREEFWLYGQDGEDAWLPQLQTRQEGDKEGTLEEMEGGESRGAPD